MSSAPATPTWACGPSLYNVTNLIACVEASEKKWNSIKEVFRPAAIPSSPQIFKDPHTANRCIYVNSAVTAALEVLISADQITGARFVEAGRGLT